MYHSDPSSIPVLLVQRTLRPPLLTATLQERYYFSLKLLLSLFRRRILLRNDRSYPNSGCTDYRRNRSRIAVGNIVWLVLCFCWGIDCRYHSNMSLALFLLRHQTVQSFHPPSIPKISSSSFSRITTLTPQSQLLRSPRRKQIRWHTSRLHLAKPVSSSSLISDDGEMMSGAFSAPSTTVVTKSKPKRPEKSTKRSVSTTAVVADTAMAAALIDEEVIGENEPDLVSSSRRKSTTTNTTIAKATRNKKALDAVDIANKTSSSVAKARPVKTTKKAVPPKASTPSYYNKNVHHQQETSKLTDKGTAPLLEPSKNIVPPEEPNFGVNDDSSISPISFHNPLSNYTGIPGMMMSSFTSSYLNTTGLPISNTTTTISENIVHRDSIPSIPALSTSGSENNTSPPEYIVISRTPIPTTSIGDDTEPNAASSHVAISIDETSSIATSMKEEELLNPYDLIPPNAATGEWKIPYPKALSPSSIKEFQACPQSFLFQYILGLRQPTTTVLAKGTMCHAALERIFDIEPQDRSLSVLQNLFRTAWSEQRSSDAYRILFEEDVLVDQLQSEGSENDGDESNGSRLPFMQPVVERRRYIQKEKTWGQEGLALLENYWLAEDASSILRPNPVQREVWVKSNLPLVLNADPDSMSTSKNVGATIRPVTTNLTTSPTNHIDGNNDNIDSTIPPTSMFLDNSTQIPSIISPIIDTGDDGSTDEANNTMSAAATYTNFDSANITKFLVRGIVDRLDMVQDPNNKTQISLRLIDYKSGKAPDLKYSPSMNLKIQNEAFDQLLIYALLLREANRKKVNPMPLRYLRLFYLTSIHDQKAIYWDMDLGATQEERDAILHTVHVSLSNVYRNICQLIDQQNFKAFHGCQRSFCYCHKCRPKFAPDTVWQPPN
jgi:RecB family exonuclease